MHGGQALDLAFIAIERFGRNGKFAHAALLVAGAGTQLQGPVRPHQGLVLVLGWLRHDLKLGHAGSAMAVAGAHAVAAGVAAANHDHVLALSSQLGLDLVACIDLVLLRQKLHGKVNAVQVAPRRGQVARLLGACSQQHGVKVLLQLLWGHGFFGPIGDLAVFGHGTHQHAGAKHHTFGLHLGHTAVDVGFFHFEIGNAVAQQAAHTVIFFKYGDLMAHPSQLLGGGQACGARTDHRHFFTGFHGWQLGLDPALRPRFVDDGVLNRLDAHGIVVHIQSASGFTGCRANAPCELWKVIGAVQHGDGVVPVPLKHQLVEVRNDVVHRAAVVAKRCAAVHTTRALRFGLCIAQAHHKFLVIFQARRYGLVALFNALKLHKAGDFSHDAYSLKVVLKPRPWCWTKRPLLCWHGFHPVRACIHLETPSQTCRARWPSCPKCRGHACCLSSGGGLPAAF